MTTFNESLHAGGYIMSEANDKTFSRDQVTIASGTALLAGSVLGKIGVSTGAPTYLATGGNTGNFTCGAVTEAAGAVLGTYTIEFIAPTVFNVTNPGGLFVGEGKTGTAFSAGGLGFTITAGGTAAIAGDSATITVPANASAGQYAQFDPAGTDGRQSACAILYADANAASATVRATITSRNTEVNSAELVWKSGVTAPQQTAAIAQLATVGIIAR